MTPYLTRVRLVSVPKRWHVWLRFGTPVTESPQSRFQRFVYFAPQSVFATVRWHGNDHGTTLWQLSILRAVAPWEQASIVTDIDPGAEVLLRVSSKTNIQRVLSLIQGIERQRIEATAVSWSYWRTVQNRLMTRELVPEYGAREHAAHLAFLRLMG